MNVPLSSSPGSLYRAPHVMPNAAHAFGGIWRFTARRFFTPGYWLMLAGLLGLLGIFSLPAAPTHAAAAYGFIPWTGGFYVGFLLPVFVFISVASAIRDDFGAGTVDYVFTRPVRRPMFVVFRYLSLMVCTQIDFLFAFALITGLGSFHGVPDFAAALPTLLFGQMIAVMLFSAFGFMAGALTSRYIILGLVYAGLVEVGLGNVPTQINQISLVRQVLGILRPILGENHGALTRLAATATMDTPGIVALLFVVSIAFVGISALVFSFREFAGSSRET